MRIILLFAELQTELKKQFAESPDSEFVISGLQGTSWNLYGMFQKIADQAGLGTIIRPFDNLRTSRSNEVRRKYGSVKESLWIGHSEEVSKKHYLVLDDEEYVEAAE